MVRSVFSEASPAAESNAAFVLSGVSSSTAGLPEQRLPVPHGVLAARGDVGGAELLDRRVGQLLRVGYELLPGPVRARRLQPGLGEQRLVVDHGQVVHHGRDADHLAVDGGHGALAGPEVVPVDPGPLDHLGQVHHLRDLRHVGRPRAVEVGDVRRAAAAHRGQHLLQRVVVVDEQRAHLLARVLRLVLGHQVRERLGLGRGVALPDLDSLCPAATAARVAVRAAAGQHGRAGEHGEQSRQGPPQPTPCFQVLSHPALRSKMRQAITNCSALCNPDSGRCKILQEIGTNVTLMSCDQGDLRRGGKRRVHPERGDRPVRLPGVPRRPAAGAVRHQRGAAGARRAARPPDIGAVRCRGDGDRDAGPARGAGGRPVCDQRGAGRRLRRHPGRLRHPGPVRGAPDDRGHAGHRRDLPRPAHHPGGAGAGPGHARGLPGGLPAQLQQPDGHAALGGVRGHRVHPGVRAVPFGPRHAGVPDLADRRRPGAGPLPHRGLQPPGLRAPLRAGRRVALPPAGRGHRGLARAPAPGPGGDLPPVRLLPHGIERALGRVRALVHAPRRPDRPVPHLRRRLPGAVGGEPARARVAGARPGLGRAAGPGARERAGLAVHPRARDRHRARAAREHPQRRADLQPAGRVLRRGALPGRGGRRETGPGRRAAAAAGRAEPDLPQRGGADRPRRAGGVPRPRLPGGPARPEHRRHADHHPGGGDVRRPVRGAPGPAPARLAGA